MDTAQLKNDLAVSDDNRRRLLAMVEDLQAELQYARRTIRALETQIRDTEVHGLSRYQHRGCRCDVCTKANSDQQRIYRRNRK